MFKKNKQTSLLFQVALFFIVGVILVGVLSSFLVYALSFKTVRNHMMSHAEAVAADLKGYIDHYPAHDWLVRYWYAHYDELDVEYDMDYGADTETAEKSRRLSERHPGFLLDSAGIGDVEALPPEDQKLYAEIVYSRLIDRIDNMQETFELDYLFCVVTEAPYDRQFVLFIAAEEGEERGSEPGQIYPIGRSIKVTGELQAAMAEAAAGRPAYALSRDGKYVDYFYSLGSMDGHELLIGLTRDIVLIRGAIRGLILEMGVSSAVFLIALAAVCLLMILFIVLRPLKKIQANIRLYKETKDSAAVARDLSGIVSRNELGRLSDDVVELTEEMDEYALRIAKITSERERIETELSLASRIQASMLPNVFPAYPDRKDFEICASMTPAKEVSGDFYDFFLLDDDHLCMLIADVSGKGIPAALFMMSSRITFSHNIKMGKSPAEVLRDANASICAQNPEGMFVTVWLGILDLKSGTLTAANAGHEYPMLGKADGDFELLRDAHGFVLGGMDGLEYSEYEIRLEPGSRLFLYTDGLAEAKNAEDRMFGTDRILAALNGARMASAEKTLERMKEAVDGFVGETEPFDDMTMMCLTYHGPEGQA